MLNLSENRNNYQVQT